jgi:putative addiction module component (TIGR02574 family)
MSVIQELEKKILALPVEQRARLAELLLSSLQPPDEASTEAEEMAEVERRERQIESGQVKPIPDDRLWQRVPNLAEEMRVTFERHRQEPPGFGTQRE